MADTNLRPRTDGAHGEDLLVPIGSGIGAPPEQRGAIHLQAAVISVGDALPSLQQVLTASGHCHHLIPEIIADLYVLAQDLGEPQITPAAQDPAPVEAAPPDQHQQVLTVKNYWGFLSNRPDRARQQILIAEALAGRKAPSIAFAMSRIVGDLLALAEVADADPQTVQAQAAVFATD